MLISAAFTSSPRLLSNLLATSITDTRLARVRLGSRKGVWAFNRVATHGDHAPSGVDGFRKGVNSACCRKG